MTCSTVLYQCFAKTVTYIIHSQNASAIMTSPFAKWNQYDEFIIKQHLKCVILRLHIFKCPCLNEMAVMESGCYAIIMSFPGGENS